MTYTGAFNYVSETSLAKIDRSINELPYGRSNKHQLAGVDVALLLEGLAERLVAANLTTAYNYPTQKLTFNNKLDGFQLGHAALDLKALGQRYAIDKVQLYWPLIMSLPYLSGTTWGYVEYWEKKTGPETGWKEQKTVLGTPTATVNDLITKYSADFSKFASGNFAWHVSESSFIYSNKLTFNDFNNLLVALALSSIVMRPMVTSFVSPTHNASISRNDNNPSGTIKDPIEDYVTSGRMKWNGLYYARRGVGRYTGGKYQYRWGEATASASDNLIVFDNVPAGITDAMVYVREEVYRGASKGMQIKNSTVREYEKRMHAVKWSRYIVDLNTHFKNGKISLPMRNPDISGYVPHIIQGYDPRNPSLASDEEYCTGIDYEEYIQYTGAILVLECSRIKGSVPAAND